MRARRPLSSCSPLSAVGTPTKRASLGDAAIKCQIRELMVDVARIPASTVICVRTSYHGELNRISWIYWYVQCSLFSSQRAQTHGLVFQTSEYKYSIIVQ